MTGSRPRTRTNCDQGMPRLPAWQAAQAPISIVPTPDYPRAEIARPGASYAKGDAVSESEEPVGKYLGIEFFEQPVYDCHNGHLDTTVVTFQIPSGTPPIHICAACWRDWCLVKGWQADVRKKP